MKTVLIYLFLVTVSHGCLVVNPRSTTSTIVTTTTETTTTEESTSTGSPFSISTATTTTMDESMTGSESTVSTVSQESTVTQDSTVSHDSTVSDHTTTISTITHDPQCVAYCNNPNNILMGDDVTFGKPNSMKLNIPNPEVCGTYQVSCESEVGKVCESVNLMASQGDKLVRLAPEDQAVAMGILECTGNGNYRVEGETMGSLEDMFCMYKGCTTVTTTTVEITTTVEETTPTTTDEGCSTCEILPLLTYSDPAGKTKPWYFDIEHPKGCGCNAHNVSCELYEVTSCDSNSLMYLSDDGLGYTMAESTTPYVSGSIFCNRDKEYKDGLSGRIVKELYCKSSNCIPVTTTPATTTPEPTTTETRNCKTCQVPTLFNYGGQDYFQPWYKDIDGGNCNCKFNEISCEMFGNSTICDNFDLMYRDIDGVEHTLAESTTQYVSGQIDCQDSGYYEIGGKILTQIYCVKNNCH